MGDILKKLYRKLLKDGWTLNQIDESDIFYLFELLSTDDEKKQEVVTYADQVDWL
jgi:hypothetical protein